MVGAFLLAAVAVWLLPPGRSLSPIQVQQRRSDSSLREMATLMLLYKNDHGGKLPQSISALVSDNRINLIKIFQAPHALTSVRPVHQLSNESVIEEFSRFAWPSVPGSKIMAFEKEGSWPDGTVAVCFKDLSVRRMDVSAFGALLEADKGGQNTVRRRD